MYREGHLGVSLLVFAPVGYWLTTVGNPEAALVTGVIMCWLAMLPDIDHRLPVITHRGVTHSLLFAGVVGSVFGAVGAVLTDAFGVAGVDVSMFGVGGADLGTSGVVLGVLTVGAHLLGDALTPAGVPLLWPFGRSYSLSVTRADSTLANYALFGGGIVVTGGWAIVAFGSL
ncbi:MAG: putative membrane-bound metal-dependent hydrolase [Halonotius sp. J07HN4]|nr:MAG: putative membrane-bound metal-dependent hydrolase [Halonotius sp. J07HN4]